MKRLNILLAAIAFLGMILTSCSEETSTAPSITIDNADPVTVVSGSVTLTGEIVAEAKLSEVKYFWVTATAESQIGSAVTSFTGGEITTSDNVTYAFRKTFIQITESGKIKIQATDKDNQTSSKSIDVTVGSAGTEINTYRSITLGSIAMNLTDPSYYSTSNNTSYKYNASGAENSDFGYLYGQTETNRATIFAPTWSSVQSLNQGPSGWSSRKATKLKTTTLTTAEFNAIGATLDADDVIETNASGSSAEYVNHLQVGGANANVKVIAFITAAGKKGLINVNSISGTDAGTINIDVKVQQ